MQSTMSLKQRELKVLRNFRVDVKVYQSFKSDEERSKYLLQKMEEDIREGLKSIDGSVKADKG